MIYFLAQKVAGFFWPKRVHDFFSQPERLPDFFGAKRLRDYF